MRREVESFLREDGVGPGTPCWNSLPRDKVSCRLNIKSPLRLAGMPWLAETFNVLGAEIPPHFFDSWEGTDRERGEVIRFPLPFSAAICGERVALNLLQRASSIATLTRRFVRLADPRGIAILDTRKTTPGLRALEKYAVVRGGGQNHRFHQRDLWMVKDNHKNFWGGVEGAVAFFEKTASFYAPILVEVHTQSELEQVLKMAGVNGRIRHLMLDNFTPEQVAAAVKLKVPSVTYEVSGGITLENISDYLLEGVDAISVGNLTSFPPPVDISMKCDVNAA